VHEASYSILQNMNKEKSEIAVKCQNRTRRRQCPGYDSRCLRLYHGPCTDTFHESCHPNPRKSLPRLRRSDISLQVSGTTIKHTQQDYSHIDVKPHLNETREHCLRMVQLSIILSLQKAKFSTPCASNS